MKTPPPVAPPVVMGTCENVRCRGTFPRAATGRKALYCGPNCRIDAHRAAKVQRAWEAERALEYQAADLLLSDPELGRWASIYRIAVGYPPSKEIVFAAHRAMHSAAGVPAPRLPSDRLIHTLADVDADQLPLFGDEGEE